MKDKELVRELIAVGISLNIREIDYNEAVALINKNLKKYKKKVENLALCAVSHRRELLKSFADWLQGEVWDDKYDDFSEYVDDYEKTL
jgi:hypothetical protein